MTDVAPFTMGIEVGEKQADGSRVEGIYLPIIERNTIIPASRVKSVVTSEDQQTKLTLQIFQGEALLVKDNIRLGKLSLTCPPAPEGEIKIDVRFTYDPSGLLEVEATVRQTGVTEKLVIEGNPGALSKDDVAEKLKALAALKIHPRDEAGNAALLARAQRLYEQRLGAARALIGDAFTAFSAALNAQLPLDIQLARKRLEKLLDEHDDESFF